MLGIALGVLFTFLQRICSLRGNETIEAMFLFTSAYAGLQISGSEFQSSNSISRELELTNLLGLVLGCIEAKFAFWQICAMPVDMGVPACSLRDNAAAGFYW